jgi:ABC-2 type transport system permease protein
MPLSYAVEAMQQLTGHANITDTLVRDVAVIAGCAVLALALGAATLRRRTA